VSRLASALVVLTLSTWAHADGGTLRLRQATGPFEVSVFTAPEPLRVGLADTSVLVQTRAGDVLLDAAVELSLRDPDGVERSPVVAHPSGANRLLQAAPLPLSQSGRWTLIVTVHRGHDRATASTALVVAPAVSPLADHAAALALPLVCVLLFVAHQRSSRRRSRGSGER
jgi:hypothetical protein